MRQQSRPQPLGTLNTLNALNTLNTLNTLNALNALSTFNTFNTFNTLNTKLHMQTARMWLSNLEAQKKLVWTTMTWKPKTWTSVMVINK